MTSAALPASRDTRALVLGTVTILALVLGSKAMPRVRLASSGIVASMTYDVRAAERTRALVASGSAIASASEASAADLTDFERITIPAATPAEAAASLSVLVGEMAAEAKMRITSTTGRSDTSFVGRYSRVSVRAFATADAQGLLELLAAIEANPQALVVRELTVTQPDPAASDDVPDALRVEIVVEALARSGTAIARAAR